MKIRKILHSCKLIIVVFLAVLATTSIAEEEENECDQLPAHNVYFFGNSYTLYNSLRGMVRNFLREHYGYCDPVNTDQTASNGGQLHRYVDNALTDLESQQEYWNYVIIQEQSQIPGMWRYAMNLYEPSLNAVVELDEIVKNFNPDNIVGVDIAQTIFYSTWGHRHGDPRNSFMWPTFLPMNQMLAEGYRMYQDAVIENDETGRPPAKVAPVGLAFEIIYNQTREDLVEEHGADAGEELLDPAQSGTDFHRLYQNDGRHPSARGTYLAACLIYATIIDYTGEEEALTMTYAPDGIDEETRDYLQMVCHLAILTDKVQVAERNAESGSADGTPPAPTSKPTAPPTNPPTAPPTNPPTAPPTNPPTKEPTKEPTKHPTRAPSDSPITPFPTGRPTEKPTMADPTANPTAKPTMADPTADPTAKPTMAQPNTQPTAEPPTAAAADDSSQEEEVATMMLSEALTGIDQTRQEIIEILGPANVLLTHLHTALVRDIFQPALEDVD